jgi:hypothetical protein
MRVKNIIITGAAAADTAAYAVAAAPTSGIAYTLTGAAASISPAREITLTSSATLAGIDFVIVGRDRNGNAITETLAGPGSATTIRSKKVFSAITSITPNGSSASTAAFGFPARVCSRWQVLDTTRMGPDLPQFSIQSKLNGSAAYAGAVVEITNEDFMGISGDGAEPQTATVALAAAGDVATGRGAGCRIVVTATAGSSAFSVARPGF